MSGLSVIIPSKNPENLRSCLAAVRAHDPSVSVIVVDDGLPAGEVFDCDKRIPGVKPFVFARNVNLGVRAAGDDDVLLLNDDAVLETPGGFTALRAAASDRADCGVISAACNNVGNRNQHRHPGGGLRAEERMVCFVCVLIPRSTIVSVGLLDERFTGYGEDDTDYCRQARAAGLKIWIFDGCYVEHSSLKSSFRANNPQQQWQWNFNRQLYTEKWGDLQ